MKKYTPFHSLETYIETKCIPLVSHNNEQYSRDGVDLIKIFPEIQKTT